LLELGLCTQKNIGETQANIVRELCQHTNNTFVELGFTNNKFTASAQTSLVGK